MHTVLSQMQSTAHDTLCIRESTLNDLSSLTYWVKTITLSHTCRHTTLDALYLAIEEWVNTVFSRPHSPTLAAPHIEESQLSDFSSVSCIHVAL